MITAAGCLIRARSTGRMLLVLRSDDCDEPGTWAGVGGTIDEDEYPVEAAIREAREETGYTGPVRVDGLVELNGYATFLCSVPDEFEPELNWEADGSAWVVEPTDVSPLHPGLAAIASVLP